LIYRYDSENLFATTYLLAVQCIKYLCTVSRKILRIIAQTIFYYCIIRSVATTQVPPFVFQWTKLYNSACGSITLYSHILILLFTSL